MAMRYFDLQHLFQTQRLRTNLQIGGDAMPGSRLVFHGPHLAILDFYGIRTTGETQRLRPQRGGSQHHAPTFLPMATTVHAPMRMGAPHGVGVVAPYAIAVDEGALPRAVCEVFDGRNGDDWLQGHSRMDP